MSDQKNRKKQDCVYILKCADGKLYTGWTNEIDRRLSMHNTGKGAKFTKGRTPVTLVYLENHPDKSAALRREAAIKKLTRKKKEQLIASSCNELVHPIKPPKRRRS